MPRKLTSTITFAALLAIAGGARAQDTAPTCNPNTGRATDRIACLNKTTRALSDKVDSLQKALAQNVKPSDLSDYIRRSDLDSFLDGYVKYNSPLAVNVASDPSTSQTTGSCLAADLDQEGVVVDKPCNYDAKSALKWQLIPALKASADNR
jgi:hypothetical protein